MHTETCESGDFQINREKNIEIVPKTRGCLGFVCLLLLFLKNSYIPLIVYSKINKSTAQVSQKTYYTDESTQSVRYFHLWQLRINCKHVTVVPTP